MIKQIVTGIAVSVVGTAVTLALFLSGGASVQAPLAGQYNNSAANFPDGINLTKSVGYRGATEYQEGGVIGAGENQARWYNDTGKDAYVSVFVKPIATTTGTTNSPIASSTMQIIAGTSTASTIANYTAPSTVTTASLLYWKLATSTVAGTLNSSSTNSFSAIGNTAPNSIVRVAAGTYLNIAILAQASVDTDQLGTPSATCGNLNCETATSTNRGFNLLWIATIKTTQN